MSGFKKAERKAIKVKLAVTGPTGSGKTYSALRLANGLGKKVAFIDTENGSASLYSDKFNFDVIDITPPFSTEKYMDAIALAVNGNYDVLVIDSITHAWSGEGGLLEQKEKMDQRGGNQFANWGKITAKQEAFKSSILQSNIHIICTIRSKMDYTQTEENGKKRIVKLGLAPQQRDGIEYDFSIVFDIAMNHEAEVSKDRTGLFTDKIFKVTENTGDEILSWLNGAAIISKPSAIKPIASIDAEPPPSSEVISDNVINEVISFEQVASLTSLLNTQKRDMGKFSAWLLKNHGIPSLNFLPKYKYDEIYDFINNLGMVKP